MLLLGGKGYAPDEHHILYQHREVSRILFKPVILVLIFGILCASQNLRSEGEASERSDCFCYRGFYVNSFDNDTLDDAI